MTIETKITKNGRTMYYADGKRISKATAEKLEYEVKQYALKQETCDKLAKVFDEYESKNHIACVENGYTAIIGINYDGYNGVGYSRNYATIDEAVNAVRYFAEVRNMFKFSVTAYGRVEPSEGYNHDAYFILGYNGYQSFTKEYYATITAETDGSEVKSNSNRVKLEITEVIAANGSSRYYVNGKLTNIDKLAKKVSDNPDSFELITIRGAFTFTGKQAVQHSFDKWKISHYDYTFTNNDGSTVTSSLGVYHHDNKREYIAYRTVIQCMCNTSWYSLSSTIFTPATTEPPVATSSEVTKEYYAAITDETDGSEDDIDETFIAVIPADDEDTDDELIDPPAIEETDNVNDKKNISVGNNGDETTLTDDFDTKIAELKANVDAANIEYTAAHDAEINAYNAWQAAKQQANAALDKLDAATVAYRRFGAVKARKLTENLIISDLELFRSTNIKITNQNGKAFYPKLSRCAIWFCKGEFTINASLDNCANYNTPAQVTDVINQLKDAIKRGDTEFKFPTVEELINTSEVDNTESDKPTPTETKKRFIPYNSIPPD